MSRTDREQIVPRVPAPRLEPEPWFVQRLSELAATSTPSGVGLMRSRARRATVIAIASAALVTGGAYAADRVTGSSLLPGDNAPQPVPVTTDHATPTPSDVPERPGATGHPTAPGGGTDDAEDTDRGPGAEDTEDAGPRSEDPRDTTDDTSDDGSEPSDGSSSTPEPDSGSDTEPTSSPSASPSPDADRESLLVQEAPTPDAVEEN